MLRPWDKHLDSDELDQLVSFHADAAKDLKHFPEGALEEAQRHVKSCLDCSRKVQMHKAVQNRISGLREQGNSPARAGCAEYVEWVEVAAGVLPQSKARELVAHAAQCGHCGPLLRQATDTLSDEATANEAEMMATLDTAQVERKRQLADMLRGELENGRQPQPSNPWRQMSWFTWRPVLLAAAAVIVVFLGWKEWQRLKHPYAEHLLAQAYTERRPFDARIPGAKFGPVMSHERAGVASNFSRPEALLKAEALIGENLRKNPTDAGWLQASARADLLDGNYDSAIASLLKAQETVSAEDRAKLLADLGTAYLLSGKAKEALDAKPNAANSDYHVALDYLGRARTIAPDDPVILFNEALAQQAAQDYQEAAVEWRRYLELYPHGDWSDEAREQLKKIDKTTQLRLHELDARLLTFEALAKDVTLERQVDDHIEEYFKQALTVWLPAAYSTNASQRSIMAQNALQRLSQVARDEHNDRWLEDLLSRPNGTQFPAAIAALASSVQHDQEGCYADAKLSAHNATALFRAAGNPAGEARAEAEEVYADQLLWEGEQCVNLERTVEQQLKGHDWAWLQAQMSLEQSNCANQVGDLGTYQGAIGRGLQQADAHHYNSLSLRALGFQALAAASMGDASTAFYLGDQGLKRFWSGEGDLMNGYNLYANLDPAAEDLKLTNAQVALWSEATNLIDHHPDTLLRAMAHLWYGKAAYRANLPGIAAVQFGQAGALFKASEISAGYSHFCQDTAATTLDLMDAEIWLANAEIRNGDLKSASRTLNDIKPVIDKTPSFDPQMGYYSAQADIAILRDDADADASKATIESAISLAERSLVTFPSRDDRRRWAELTRSAYRDAVEWELRRGKTTAALELWEWHRGAEFRVAPTRTHSPTASDQKAEQVEDPLQLQLPAVVAERWPQLSDETDITYASFPKGLEVWIYDNRGISARWISVSSAELRDEVYQFESLCADPDSDLATLRTTGARLYKVLIGPVEDRLIAGRTLVIEPEGYLGSIPWDALVNGNGQYLAEKFALVVSPGLYRRLRLRASVVITRETPVLVVSVPAVSDLKVPVIPEVDEEAGAVKGEFSSGYWLRGHEATLTAIQRHMSQAAVFHFAGHAIATPDHSGLMLAELDSNSHQSQVIDGQSITADESEHLQLAVLSACRTGAEAQLGDTGTENLADALLLAGTPHVVVSRWNIDSRKTADFMKQLYASLLAGKQVSEALHTAQLTLASQADSAHPYYWASFELEGTK